MRAIAIRNRHDPLDEREALFIVKTPQDSEALLAVF